MAGSKSQQKMPGEDAEVDDSTTEHTVDDADDFVNMPHSQSLHMIQNWPHACLNNCANLELRNVGQEGKHEGIPIPAYSIKERLCGVTIMIKATIIHHALRKLKTVDYFPDTCDIRLVRPSHKPPDSPSMKWLSEARAQAQIERRCIALRI
ncbi:uncharacterized protein LAESUDRAFT_713479 [Laetiporus sulphureus 93-53]|uniref:Uncharacterized protein n=1 Tax=Laetiporus sulphureus 93-53 TaxID=1314785 RepID=A0A165EUY4_9APHY|nr:uncharacterized protein LAESUDRAFT_713479 [Laetiporus sulphureus 93-53]KZT07814.1 hypothetical protein LAESUDRAFT_713479 [Laetiporus sulphureus 93-53]